MVFYVAFIVAFVIIAGSALCAVKVVRARRARVAKLRDSADPNRLVKPSGYPLRLHKEAEMHAEWLAIHWQFRFSCMRIFFIIINVDYCRRHLPLLFLLSGLCSLLSGTQPVNTRIHNMQIIAHVSSIYAC